MLKSMIEIMNNKKNYYSRGFFLGGGGGFTLYLKLLIV